MIAAEVLPAQFNVATWFVDRHVDEGRGGAPAFHHEGRTLSYADVHELANRTGNALLDLGVERQDRVLLLCLDAPEFIGAFWRAIAPRASSSVVRSASARPWRYMTTM